MVIPIALFIVSAMLLLYLGYAIGVTHGRHLERRDRLRHLQERYDALDDALDTLENITIPRNPARDLRWN